MVIQMKLLNENPAEAKEAATKNFRVSLLRVCGLSTGIGRRVCRFGFYLFLKVRV